MGIIVIDQSPELYWFVSNALLQLEIPLKHIKNIQNGEERILHELPEIVILNGDDKTLPPAAFVNKMRNHVFARNTHFIVFTSDSSIETKQSLLIAGVGQIFYRGRNFSPSPKFFLSIVKWFLNTKNPDAQLFDYKPLRFEMDADFTSYGRIGWISHTHCLIETNVELAVGQSIEIENSLFEELKIKNLNLECIEKNKEGRYYQYANSLLCKIITNDLAKDSIKIKTWIQNNADVIKNKSIKIVYFESDPDLRSSIKTIIKADRRYCARGYAGLDDFQEVLDYQIPHLIFINRSLIAKNKVKFDKLKDFMKTHFCYCVTYASDFLLKIEDFKKNFDFAVHSPSPIDLPLLESMVKKLEEKFKEKFPDSAKLDKDKMFFSKHSPYSRITLHASAKLTDIDLSGAGIELPFILSNFGGCNLSCQFFSLANLDRSQFFRAFSNKSNNNPSAGIYHRLIFMGQTVKENASLKETFDKIAEIGKEKWLDDVAPALAKEKNTTAQ